MRTGQHRRPPGRAFRLAAGGLAVPAAALCLTMTGVTLASFSATEASGQNAVAATTVTLTNSAIANCPVSNLLPTGTATSCTFTTTYPGPSSAYLAVNVLVETQAGTGGTALYNPGGSGGLSLTITSSNPAVSYTLPTAATTCPAGAPSGSACYELDNELVSTSSLTTATVSFTVSVDLPTSSTTGYQGGTAQIILTTHAVQSGNDALSCTTTPAAGSPCTPAGSFSWS